ncbi:ADP-ribose pyrophosphatase YjhB, NUDIX family [Limimonas halophila]|uniref:ADP-ribose pyrophosphatase YjhB, NUDIX family n=1 Tax=Limimonas halophila TaxID=1082479 RepID=A0A1G7NKQ9_9PROT|nr:NUDIX hydrolase [Limimonas halophila]SDF74705.1 ADP-ribose pyrophosphatase YjhB, NUDIX family [Limimonas halophila]
MTASGTPTPAVLAVVWRAGRVLLARRAKPPQAHLWGFPGGKIEFGEPMMDAAVRELREETGVTADPVAVIDAVDVIDPQTAAHHYVLIAVLTRWTAGEGRAASDVDETAWFAADQLPAARSPGVDRVASAAARRMTGTS